MSITFKKAPQGRGEIWTPSLVGSDFADFGLCGATAGFGLFRFHDKESGPIGQEFVDESYGPDGLVAEVFGYDWLARQFAVSSNASLDGERTVVVLSPFDMSVTPWVPVEEFMQAIQYDIAVEFLRHDLFQSWREREGIDILTLDRCAGTTVPAYYGGELALRNLENNDLDVYLTFSTELWKQSRARTPGSPPPVLRVE